jgi:hypothetical protein
MKEETEFGPAYWPSLLLEEIKTAREEAAERHRELMEDLRSFGYFRGEEYYNA